MPDPHVSRTRHVIVHAYPEETYEAIGSARMEDPLLRIAFHLTRLPQRVRMRMYGRSPSADPTAPNMKQFSWREGWLALDERPGDEIVSGAAIRLRGWMPGRPRIERIAASDFATYQEPGRVKIAMSMSVRPYGESRTLLVQDVRARATDPATRRLLETGWRWTTSIQDMLNDRVLHEIKEQAERPHPPPGAPPRPTQGPAAQRPPHEARRG